MSITSWHLLGEDKDPMMLMPSRASQVSVSEQLKPYTLDDISTIHRFYRIGAYDEDVDINYEKCIEDHETVIFERINKQARQIILTVLAPLCPVH